MVSIKFSDKKTILFTAIPIIVILLLVIFIAVNLIYSANHNFTQNMSGETNITGSTSTNPALLDEQKKLDASFSKAMADYEKSSPLLRYMPVHENLFTIDYLGKGIYRITLLGLNKTLSKNESRKWWLSHQVDPAKLNIEYVPEV